MICSLSDQPCEQPVASPRSGAVFEKRLIEKYVDEEGKDPISGEELAKEELVALKVQPTARPRPVTAASIPGLLTMFQNEYDELVLETFTLKQHLDRTRHELSQALYQHDAACRIIARLMRERDEARAQLAAVGRDAPQAAPAPADGNGAAAMQQEAPALGPGIPKSAISAMVAKGEQLLKSRKGRKPPPDLRQRDQLAELNAARTATPHRQPSAAIHGLASSLASPSVVLTAGADHDAVVFDVEGGDGAGEVMARLAGHSKRVTAVAMGPEGCPVRYLTGSADKTVRAWGADGAEAACFSDHAGAVVGVAVQPTGDYAVSFGGEGAWCFYDLATRAMLRKVAQSAPGGFASGAFHPDGLIVGVGTTLGGLQLWDMRSQEVVSSLSDQEGPVTALAFSEKGYHLATGASNGVRLWDLRKLVRLASANPSEAVASVAFDASGTYLAWGTSDVMVGTVKEWGDATRHTLSGHAKAVTGLSFGPKASFLVSASLDTTVKVWT